MGRPGTVSGALQEVREWWTPGAGAEKDGAALLYGGRIVSRGGFLILTKARFDIQIISAVLAGSMIREGFDKLYGSRIPLGVEYGDGH